MTRTGMCWAYCVAASTSGGALGEDLVDQFVADLAGGLFQLSIALGAKAGSRMRRESAWNGRIRRDGRGVADGRQALGLADADDHAFGAEVLGVVGDRRDVFVAGGQPHATVALGVRHRAAFAQLVPDLGGGLGVVVGGVVEVGRPVAGGLCRSVMVCSPGPGVVARCVDNRRYRGPGRRL